jgi:hypothetical protein
MTDTSVYLWHGHRSELDGFNSSQLQALIASKQAQLTKSRALRDTLISYAKQMY